MESVSICRYLLLNLQKKINNNKKQKQKNKKHNKKQQQNNNNNNKKLFTITDFKELTSYLKFSDLKLRQNLTRRNDYKPGSCRYVVFHFYQSWQTNQKFNMQTNDFKVYAKTWENGLMT